MCTIYSDVVLSIQMCTFYSDVYFLLDVYFLFRCVLSIQMCTFYSDVYYLFRCCTFYSDVVLSIQMLYFLFRCVLFIQMCTFYSDVYYLLFRYQATYRLYRVVFLLDRSDLRASSLLLMLKSEQCRKSRYISEITL